MADAINEIIDSLERQRAAIDNALEALRGVQGSVQQTGGAGTQATTSAGRGRGAAKRKGGMTPEGRKRLAEAMRRRWAAKRAGSQVKKAAAKRGPRKKAAA